MLEDILAQIEQNNEQSVQLRQQGDYSKAFTLALQNYQIVQMRLPTDHQAHALAVGTLATLLVDSGDYTSAEPLLNDIVEFWRSRAEQNRDQYAQSLNNLADLYRRTARYAEAVSLYQQAIDIWRTEFGENHPQLAIGFNNLAQVYSTCALYENAKILYLQALEILRRQPGEQSPEYLQTLNNLASLYEKEGQYQQAEPLYQQILHTRSAILGMQHPDTATSLNNLAGLLIKLEAYENARSFYIQALAIWRATFGTHHPSYLTTLNNLSFVYKQQGEYSLAEKSYRRVLAARKKLLGPKHPSTATSMHNLAALYEIVGKYASARRLYRQALAIRIEVFGEQHPSTATTIHNLAALSFTIGDYPGALQGYQQALALRKAALGEHHPLLASTLNNLAGVYHNIGNDSKALELQRQANELYRETIGEQHPDYAVHLHNLALFTFSQGNTAEAKQLYQQAITLRAAILGEQHPEMAPSLHNLAVLDQMSGEYEQAEELYQRALTIERHLLGERHVETAASLHNLALLYHMQGHYQLAQQLYQEAGDIWRETLGLQHPYLISNLNNQAILFVTQQQEQQALSALQEAAALSDSVLGSIFATSSAQQRMAYLATIRHHYEVFLSFIFLHTPVDASLAQTGLNLVLRRKGLSVEALQIQRSIVWKSRYPEQKKLIQNLEEAQTHLASITLAGPDVQQTAEIYQQQRRALQNEIEELEVQLARQIPEINLTRQLRSADWQVLARALPAGSALIEFVRFDPYNFQAVPARGDTRWLPACYGALVLHTGTEDSVTLIQLGDAGLIDQLITRFRSEITMEEEPDESALLTTTRSFKLDLPLSDEANEEKPGAALRQKIFDPLVPAFQGCTQLFLVPDGDLTRVPFEILPLEEVHGLFLLDHYQLHYLSSGRDLLRFQVHSRVAAGAPFVLANPDFGLIHSDVEAESASLSSPDFPHYHPFFRQLLDTQKEGQQIADLLGVPLCSGKKALKSYIRRLHAPLLLHMATHGFFAQGSTPSLSEEQTLLGMLPEGRIERLVRGHIEDPLLRSGLALAGANIWMQGDQLPASAENGLLTAVDVANMDLQGNELVVLSACQTGLGDIHDGEGVFGLRSSFVVAGAKRLVMSLWKVPDQQTQELMKSFYEGLRCGLSCSAALHDAQQHLKATYPHPFYWGAFICQGDPAPLPAEVFRYHETHASLKKNSSSTKSKNTQHDREV